jgi:hypothetical protein
MDIEQFRLTTGSPASGIRASDADRERMLELLRAHHLEGRLDASEFQERLERARFRFCSSGRAGSGGAAAGTDAR